MPPRKRSKPAPADPSPRIARRELRRQRSRDEILEAARRVLVRDGLAATTLDAIAREVGLTKAALYYYYRSKDQLLFEIGFSMLEAQANAVHDAVVQARDGGEALRAIIRSSVHTFAARMDDFRLTFLQNQVAGQGVVEIGPAQLAQIRPLNELLYAHAAHLVGQNKRTRARVDPRLMAFLASAAAVGLLTMKGMVESAGDPLRYTDAEMVEGLARIFEAAARP